MLKDYLNEKNLSMYKVSKEGGIPYSTLNDLVNGRVEIENCKVSLLLQLGTYLGLSLDEVYAVAKGGKAAGAAEPEPIEIPKPVLPPIPMPVPNGLMETQPIPAATVDFETMLHNRLAPGKYIGKAAENKENLLQLMISEDRKEDSNDFDHLRRICKRGGMSEDYFKKGLAYIIMTDYILGQQSRSLENVFIEKNPDGSLKRFMLPESTFDVLFISKAPKGDEITNLDTAFLKKKERKLLKLVVDKSVIDLNQVPDKDELEKKFEALDLPGKRIKKLCGWYEERISSFKIWLAE